MNKQTVVDWLVNKVYMVIPDSERSFLEGLKEMAKEMEKEQINKACYDGYYQEELYDTRNYYDQTYNQDRITISETKRSIEGIGLNNQK